VTDSLVRIKRHPTDRDVFLAHVSPDDAVTMGRFAPARFAHEHKAFLIHADLLGQFATFARVHHWKVVDERKGPQTQTHAIPQAAPECANCGQPARSTTQPKTCPACGQSWVPVVYRATVPGANRTPCPKCSNKQTGRFKFCGRCGERMVYPEPSEVPDFIRPRVKLSDPQPLGDAVSDLGLEPPEPQQDEWVACTSCFRPTDSSAVDDDGLCAKCRPTDEPLPDPEGEAA
jgi:hypothetical protein